MVKGSHQFESWVAGDSHVSSRSSEPRLTPSGIPSLTDCTWTSLTDPAGGHPELGADELHHAMPCKQDKDPEYRFSSICGVGPARIISLFSPWTHCGEHSRSTNHQKMRGRLLWRFQISLMEPSQNPDSQREPNPIQSPCHIQPDRTRL